MRSPNSTVGCPRGCPRACRRFGCRVAWVALRSGLRLPMADFDRLAEFGRAYGVAPATMARILVVRALRAVVVEDESS